MTTAATETFAPGCRVSRGFLAIALGASLVASLGAAVSSAAAQPPETAPAAPIAAPVAAPAEAAFETPAGAPAEASAEPSPPAAKAVAALPSALPSDLSPWGMFLHADLIVKAVMSGLAFASLVTWTIWLAKTIELLLARRAARRDLETLAGAPNLRAAEAEFKDKHGPIALFVKAAADEGKRSAGLSAEGVKERIAALLSRLEANAGRKMARGTFIIATIGSTAPFIGLFGTVWGIMDSFIGISKTHTTNLAVVAPGIAEALLATAMGLVAAIPAVMIYNAFARGIAGYRARLADAAAEVIRHVSRDLDREASAHSGQDARVIAMRRPAE